MYEKYLKVMKLVENKDLFENLLNEFQKRIENFFNEHKQKKDIIGKKLDSFLIDDIMEIIPD